MTIHQCPKCELRFDWKTELDDHCWHDHPEFRHEYPAVVIEPDPAEQAPLPTTPAEVRHTHIGTRDLGAWLQPTRSRAHPERHVEDDQQPPPQ
jgi:hypothetical protein